MFSLIVLDRTGSRPDGQRECPEQGAALSLSVTAVPDT